MGLTEIDFGALKQRLLGSIAVIAAVDALAWYLDLEKTTDTAKLGWVDRLPADVRCLAAVAGDLGSAWAAQRQSR